MQTPLFRFVYTDFKTAGIVKGLQQESFIAHLIDEMMDADPRRRKQVMEILLEDDQIHGYTGFLFLDKNEMPMVALHWEHYFKHIRTKYNKIYRIQLPKITPHVCRHTFCSNMAKSGMNPKTLQYIMGHSDIGITLDTYTHLKIEDAQEEFDRCLEA